MKAASLLTTSRASVAYSDNTDFIVHTRIPEDFLLNYKIDSVIAGNNYPFTLYK